MTTLPFLNYPLLNTDDLYAVENFFIKNFEKRRYIIQDDCRRPSVAINLVRMEFGHIGAVRYGCNLRSIFLEPINDLLVVAPIAGTIINNTTGQKISKGEALILSPSLKADIT